MGLAERLYSHVEKTDSCWLWTGATTNGYGVIGEGARGSRTLKAHRVAYELDRGPVPVGLDLDHLCRVRNCVNPAHLEPVTRRENLRRSPIANKPWTHCKQGHDLSTARVTRKRNGGLLRQCRICEAARGAARRALCR